MKTEAKPVQATAAACRPALTSHTEVLVRQVAKKEQDGFEEKPAQATSLASHTALCSYPLKLGRSKILKSKGLLFTQFCSKF